MKKKVIDIFKNILMFIVSMFLIISITFFLLELVPGKSYDLDYIKNENVIKNLNKKYGYDKSTLERYKNTLIMSTTLDFGNSYTYETKSVKSIIFDGFTVSSKIGLLAIIVSLINGITLGFKIFKNRKEKKHNINEFIMISISSIPTFVIAALLQYILCVKLKIFNVYGLNSVIDYILPVFILSIFPTIFIARVLEKKLIETHFSDYIVFSKANGINQKNIIIYYYLKNCLSPILSYMGTLVANLLVGSFVIETIFNIPGLGKYFISSILNRDFPLIMGLTVFFAFILMSSTFIFNILAILINYRGDILNEK